MSNYEKLSDTPYTVMISPQLLGERLSAISYNNSFLSFMQAVANSELTFVNLGEHFDISAMIGWKNLTTEDYVAQGIKMLRVADIKDRFVSLENVVQVSPDKVQEQPQIHLKQGDIVYSKDGTLGIAAVVPDVKELICAGSTLARVRLKKHSIKILDQYFAIAFLNCEFAHSQVSYYTNGIAQPHITQEYIAKLRIPLPDPIIQAYIGDKVRLAEKCREEAINLWERAKQILADSLGLALSIDTYQSYDLKDLETNFYQAISKTPVICWAYPNIVDDRIGAQFFHPRRENIIQKLRGSCEVKKLSDLAKRVTKRISAEKAAHLGYVGLSEIDSTNGFFEPISMDQAETVGVSSYFESRDVLFSKLRPYLNKVSICPDYINEACGSTELLVYRANGSIPPYYLFFVLKSNIGLYQIIDLTAGSTLPRVDSDIIDDLLIPLISKDMQGEIDHKIHMVFNLLQSARDLIHQSQSDVEALIENRLPVDQVLSGKLCAPTFDGIYNQLQ